MAKPTSTSALKTRLNTLKTELDELQRGGAELYGAGNGAAAEGLSRVVREMRKALQRAEEQGYFTKL